MSKPNDPLMNSSEAPSTDIKRRWLAALRRVLGFGAKIAVLSLLISGIAQIWIHDLSWWKIFRRCVSVSAVLVLWHTHRHHPHPFRSLGLGSWREGRGAFAKGVLIGLSMMLALIVAYDVLDIVRLEIWTDTARVVRTMTTFAPTACLIGLLEELTFRGYLLQQLLACSQWFALAVTSALYAVVHVQPTMTWPNSAFELVGLFLLGWVLGMSVLRTRSLYLAIGLHASLAYFARVNKMWIEFTNPSWVWLVGSHRIVNGIVGWGSLLLLGWLISRTQPRPQRLST